MVSENEAFHALTTSIERIKSCGGKFSEVGIVQKEMKILGVYI